MLQDMRLLSVVSSISPSPGIISPPNPFAGGQYEYMRELQAFNRRVPPAGAIKLPVEFCTVTTPLKVKAWEWHLRALPDRDCANYLLKGLREGFRIGFDYQRGGCKSAKSNMLSARQNPHVVDEYLQVERAKGRILGPVDAAMHALQVNRFGVIPKGHNSGKWRFIVDLSHPEGASVNDGIDPSLCSLSYTSVDWAAKLVIAAGKGSLLAKVDLENAYRMVPVHPEDRLLLGMKWHDRHMVDSALPFELRSAPKLFNVVADCLQWIFRQRGIQVIHYLDDFLIVGPARTGECLESLHMILHLCDQLGVKVSEKKLEGPTTTLTFLGILLDTERMELRLPEDKLSRLKDMIEQWRSKKVCRKRQLLSLLGHLHHACQVVKPGRSFLRRIIELSKRATKLHHRIRLNAEFRSDLEWWSLFVSEWNGVGMMSSLGSTTAVIMVTSDASGTWGCGAFTSAGQWFQFRWPASWATVHITVKELLPIIMAGIVWGRAWSGKRVQCLSDNAAAVDILNSGKSKDKLAMHLLHCLFFFSAEWRFTLHATHLAERLNVAADALSRDNLSVFFRQVPEAAIRAAEPIPDELQELLVHQRPDWTSPAWRKLFAAILQRV